MHQEQEKTLELEDINYQIIDEKTFIDKFTVYVDSKLFQIQRNFKIEEADNLLNLMKQSPIKTGIMISEFKIKDKIIYIFILDNIIFIINKISLTKFNEYFKEHSDSLLFLKTQTMSEIPISAKVSISEQIDHIFSHQKVPEITIKEIVRCILKKSQYRTIKMRTELIPNEYNINKKYKYDDFIQIQLYSSDNDVKLYYNSREQILNILKIGSEHENNFYEQIENSFPFICKIFGKTQIGDRTYIVLEYIEGEQLDKFIINHNEIDFSTKIKIIIEILFSIYHIHSNGIYLRDLKPDNIIIDSNYNSNLIDFDFSKEMKSQDFEVKTTSIGSNIYAAPEQLRSEEYSYKVDSYSVGMIIHFIITGKECNFTFDELTQIYCNKENIMENNKFPKCPKEYENIQNIYKQCFSINPKLRPSIVKLIMTIIFDNKSNEIKKANEDKLPYIIKQFEKYTSKYKISTKYEFDEPIEQSYLNYFIGYIYYFGHYVSRDINKSIYYSTLSSNQYNSKAQCLLGGIYYNGKYISRDINKSIQYLTLSSNQNDSDAQCLLGEIYYNGKYISRNINKSIQYLTLSSNQNNSDAQYLLGGIYYNGKYVSRDINKSFYYLTLSSNQYNSNAQCLLGKIYYEGKYISRDINKSIQYLTLSSNQNDSNAQYLLGVIYYEGKYVSRDINKSIQYLTLSSNQNNSDAQYLLGVIYYADIYNTQDINKSIYYLTLSSNQYNSYAQYLLGKIFSTDEYIRKNINKAIHYFKESSSFNNEYAKNNLGIIYKNGDGVEKNIYNAIEYFEEAIKQKNDSYSMYNLARIYYFGIDIDRNIDKSIELLEKATNDQILIADLFLFYIYTFCDEPKYLDQNKSVHYQKNSQIIFWIIYTFNNFIMLDNNIILIRLHQFFKDYDLAYPNDYISDVVYFLLNGQFFDWTKYKEKKTSTLNIPQKKNINEEFYNGFYDS